MSGDIHALSGAYAVDALDDLERVQVERHLAECSACRAEIDSLREAAALLAETTAGPVPAGLRSRVLADIATVRPLPPLVASAQHARTRTKRRGRGFPALVAAAAAVIAIGAGSAIVQPWQDETVGNRSATASEMATQRVLEAVDAEQVVRDLDNGAQITLTRSKALNQAVVTTSGLSTLPDDKIYELWLIHGEDMVNAGLMEGGDTQVLLEGDPVNASGAGITIEPAGGSEEPSRDLVTTMTFRAA